MIAAALTTGSATSLPALLAWHVPEVGGQRLDLHDYVAEALRPYVL